MQKIPLTRGQFALVDDADYSWLSQWKWYVYKNHTGDFYAVRNSSRRTGKRHNIYMHRQILGLARGGFREGDHINHSTLDNRRNNLRICTSQQNAMNRKKQPHTTSKFKGVSWHKASKKWRVRIQIDGVAKFLGYFIKEKIAALAYDKEAMEHFGDFAKLNF